MQCAICGEPCNRAFLRLGGYCSDEHREVLLQRHRQRLVELRQENVQEMPPVLTPADFERLALKLAVHLLTSMSPILRQLYQAMAPGLLDPLEMAGELKARILRRLPDTHVSMQGARGLACFFHDGTYTFLRPVPAALLQEAMQEAHLWPENE